MATVGAGTPETGVPSADDSTAEGSNGGGPGLCCSSGASARAGIGAVGTAPNPAGATPGSSRASDGSGALLSLLSLVTQTTVPTAWEFSE